MTKRFFLAPLLLAALLAACNGDGSTAPTPRSPTRVRITGGDAQAGTVGQPLPVPLAVRVEDAAGDPISGYPVLFRILSGGGSVSDGADVTAADGGATTTWTLGHTPGTQQVEARVTDLTGAVLAADTFTATAAATPAQTITVVGSPVRSGAAGLPVDSLVVRVTDAFGNPVAGQPLVWTVTAGGGSVSGSATTDANGIGRGVWTLGSSLGAPQTVRVFAGVSLATDFTATATLPTGTNLAIVSGSGQTGTVGQPLADSLVVAVTLPSGLPAVGVDVQWQPGPGGGSVSPVVSRTGANGRAAVRRTLGAVAGIQSVTAGVAGTGGATFLATARAAAPVSMTLVSGSGQAGPPGRALPSPLVVELRDAYGNLVSGWVVQWAVAAGGGSVSPSSSVTDASGRAQTRWTLAASGAGGSVVASSDAVEPVTFTSPGSPTPARVTVVSGNAQSAPAGSPLSNAVVARVVDANGTPLPGVTVHWVVTAGRGEMADSVVTTDAAGLAYGSWALGPVFGVQHVVEARVDGVATAATFTAASTSPAVTITRVAGEAQSQTVYTNVPNAPTVRVALTDGRPLQGAVVQFVTLAGTVAPGADTTDANGLAQTSWRMGAVPGPQTMTASSLGSSTTFAATAIPLLTIVSGNNQRAAPYLQVRDSLVVRAARADGTPVAGLTINWVPTGGSVSPTSSVTDAQGLARTTYTTGGTGTYQVLARAPAYGNTQVAFTENSVTPVLIKVSGDNQTAPPGTLPQPLVVRLLDADGNPLAGVAITFNRNGAGSVNPATMNTDAQGYASTQWTLLGKGTYTLTAYTQTYGLAVQFRETIQ